MHEIEFHADDYGLFPAQSQEILDCYKSGCLNAISIMPNSPYLSKCMDMLQSYIGKIKVAVHLNFMEGRCLSDPKQVYHLVDDQGIFHASFGKHLLADFLPGREEYRQQLYREICAQICKVKEYLPPGMPLRIDGHAHYHMLPSVFDSLIQVIQTEGWSVEYIRFPRENWSVYFGLKNLENMKLINIIKVIVLNLLVARNRRKHNKYLADLEQRIFIGVALSGAMTKQNVSSFLPKAIQTAKKKALGIELLAHPGGVYKSKDISQLTHPDDIAFLTSSFRGKEKEMLYVKWIQ